MNKKLVELIAELQIHADQNEIDARRGQWTPHSRDTVQAKAVAAEQRRVIAKLKDILKLDSE